MLSGQILSKSLEPRPTWKCLFTPLFQGFGSTFPPNDVTHRLNSKRTINGLNHVIWAINRENLWRGSSWALERNKEEMTWQDRKKVTKGLYFTYLWRSPHWSDVNESLFSGWCSRRNHVCQVSKWNFQGLRFYRWSNFPFSYWFLNGPYNSAALVRCLWWRRNSSQNSRLVQRVYITLSSRSTSAPHTPAHRQTNQYNMTIQRTTDVDIMWRHPMNTVS